MPFLQQRAVIVTALGGSGVLLAVAPACAQGLDPALGAGGLGPLLQALPASWLRYVPLVIAGASVLDAGLPQVAPGSWLALPRALITTLAGNVANAANAKGMSVFQAARQLRGAGGGVPPA